MPVVFWTFLKSLSRGCGAQGRFSRQRNPGARCSLVGWQAGHIPEDLQELGELWEPPWGSGVSRMRSQVKNHRRGFWGASHTAWCDPCEAHQGAPVPPWSCRSTAQKPNQPLRVLECVSHHLEVSQSLQSQLCAEGVLVCSVGSQSLLSKEHWNICI